MYFQLQNMLNQPSSLNNICLFLDEVVFIDVGKHRQSWIDGLLRRISQVLANQKHREKSKWVIRVFRRSSGFRLGLIHLPLDYNSHFDSRLVNSLKNYSYLQVHIFLHHLFNNLQYFLPIISVREVWKEILIINPAFLVNKQKKLPKKKLFQQ